MRKGKAELEGCLNAFVAINYKLESLDTEVAAHAVVVLQHVLVCAEVYRGCQGGFRRLTEFVVVLGKFAVAERPVLVDDAADLDDAAHARRVSAELDDLHFPL